MGRVDIVQRRVSFFVKFFSVFTLKIDINSCGLNLKLGPALLSSSLLSHSSVILEIGQVQAHEHVIRLYITSY